MHGGMAGKKLYLASSTVRLGETYREKDTEKNTIRVYSVSTQCWT